MQKTERDNSFEWNQFCRLGEMMGDGLHHEPDGKWISKEYTRLSKILIPELKEEASARRKIKSDRVDNQMLNLIAKIKCECGGALIQRRKGTKIAYCETCNTRYVAKSKKSR